MSNRGAGSWRKPDPKTYIVQMENLSSEEVYLTPDGAQRPVLTGNTLDVCRGQSWGVIGREVFEIELLLQIVGCVRPYGTGRCKLVERGMMRKKRKILPHVFFVGDSGMAVPNMNVLEYLMFATRFTPDDARMRQAALLQAMLDSGCYEWCFAPVKQLSSQERAVLSLLAASFSDALLYIFPYFYPDTPEALRGMLGYIARKVEGKRAALLMGASDPALVQAVCTHSAFLLNGTLSRVGTLDEVTKTLDRRDYILHADDPAALLALLAPKLPDYELRARGPYVDIYHREREVLEQGELLRVLTEAGASFKSLRVSERTLANAFSEACNDLPD